eukprot:scaffold5530_cov283-Chaetoceros_neogracile.AAC.4
MDWLAGEERLGTHSNRNKLSLQANGIMMHASRFGSQLVSKSSVRPAIIKNGNRWNKERSKARDRQETREEEAQQK